MHARYINFYRLLLRVSEANEVPIVEVFMGHLEDIQATLKPFKTEKN